LLVIVRSSRLVGTVDGLLRPDHCVNVIVVNPQAHIPAFPQITDRRLRDLTPSQIVEHRFQIGFLVKEQSVAVIVAMRDALNQLATLAIRLGIAMQVSHTINPKLDQHCRLLSALLAQIKLDRLGGMTALATVGGRIPLP
jgi:hypothetical protein